MSIASAPDGTGGTTALNRNTSTVQDKGAATGQSGMAIAQTGGGSAQAGGSAAPVAPSLTDAASGGARATGLSAQNVIQTGSQAVVQVAGNNSAPISVRSDNTVLVRDEGASAANSGAATASLDPQATPGLRAAASRGGAGQDAATTLQPLADASPLSTNVTAVGAVVSNNVQQSQSSLIVAPTGTPTSIRVDQTQAVTSNAGGQASAASDPACAGTACGRPVAARSSTPLAAAVPSPGDAGAQGSQDAQARTGEAVARGAQVQNLVNTRADVRVRVGGENRGVIQVIINAVTSIFNQGTAASTSGAAAATSGTAAANGVIPAVPLAPPADPSVAGAPAAGSGGVQTTGAVVNNNVSLQSSADVQVNGDNHNPITIILRLTARLFNRGDAQATSGDAQASGQGSGEGAMQAQSGAVSATGLVAQNQVNLDANANVDISGNNDATISIEVDFETDIQNVGKAVAISGKALAQSSPTPQPSVLVSTAAQGSKSNPSKAAPVASADLPASPVATAAGSSGDTTTGTTSVEQSAGLQVNVKSGDSRATGVHDSIVAVNDQVSVASGSGHAPSTASSETTYLIAPCGKAVAGSGSTYVNTGPTAPAPVAALIAPSSLCPTPTPSPSPAPQPSGGSGGGSPDGSGPSGAGAGQQSGPGPDEQGAATASQPEQVGPPAEDHSPKPQSAPLPSEPATGSTMPLNLFSAWPGPNQLAVPSQQLPPVALLRPVPSPLSGRSVSVPIAADGPPALSSRQRAEVSDGLANRSTDGERGQSTLSLGQQPRSSSLAGASGSHISVAPFASWPQGTLPDMPNPSFQEAQPPAKAIAVPVAVPPTELLGPGLEPRLEVPLSSYVLMITMLTGLVALVLRWLWKQPAVRAGVAWASTQSQPLVVFVNAFARRGRRWLVQATSLLFLLLLAFVWWRK